MPTSKTALSSTSIRIDQLSANEELPFVSKHARVVTAFGTESTLTALFAVGSSVAVASAALKLEDRTKLTSSTSTVQYRLNAGLSGSPVVHLSVAHHSGASSASSASVADDLLREMVISSRTAVVAACANGQVVALRTAAHSTEADAPAARRPPRSESSADAASSPSLSSSVAWEPLVRWNAVEGDAERWALPADALLGNRGAAFCVARYAETASAAEAHQLVASHEAFREARLFDLSTGAVVHRIYTAHGPVALQVVHGAWSSTPLIAVAEGPVASLWDARIGSVGSSACVSRLTLYDADVMDLCATPDLASRNVIATASTDRDITLYDARKWAKVSVEQNVLKYAPVGIASAGVCSRTAYFPTTLLTVGFDSEVRAVDINSSASLSAAKKVAKEATSEDHSAAAAASSTAEVAEGSSTTEPLQGIFRQRLASSQHCKAAWHGAPAQCVVGGQLWAVAMSTHGELFGLSSGFGA